jgi:hypothetical protein
MPAHLLHAAASVICPHSGVATPIAPDHRVLVSGQPVFAVASPVVVAGCGNAVPCADCKVTNGTTRVHAGGVALATRESAIVSRANGAMLIVGACQGRVTAV